MSTKRLLPGFRSFVTLFDSGSLGSQSDRDLLECFQTDPGPIGQEAFRILVERHGPMVLGLCRSVVRDQHEAEDAFQATFLVLVRKAASIERRDTLGPWLHGVAAKVARRARHRLNDRRKHEVPVAPDIPGRDLAAVDDGRSERLVHEEIARLPDSFRKPLVLCCLQGLSYDLAAQQLGVNPSTLRGRLERARKRLHSRLQRRGIPVHAGGPSIASLPVSLPPLPCPLIEATVQFSLKWSRLTGLLGGGTVVPQSIAALAQGVVQSMFLQTIRVSAAALLAIGAIGTVVVAQQRTGRVAEDADPAIAGRAQEDSIKRTKKRTPDQPDGNVTAVDEKRLLITRSDSFEYSRDPKGGSPFASRDVPPRFALIGKMDIDRDGSDDRKELKGMIQGAGGVVDFDLPPPDSGKETGKISPKLDWYVIDERLPLRESGQQAVGPLLPDAKFSERVRAAVKEARLNGIRPMTIGKLLAYLEQDPNAKPAAAKAAPIPRPDATARVRQKLDMVVGADFPKTASLETLLKTIKKITTDATYPGIPIYVDPAGIKDVKLTMEAQVTEIVGDQPIRNVLSDSLRPLGLMYDVRDGFLMISSRTAILEHRVEEIDHKLDRVIEMLGRLEQKN